MEAMEKSFCMLWFVCFVVYAQKGKRMEMDRGRRLRITSRQSWMVAISEGDEELEEDGNKEVGGEAIGGRELHENDFVADEEQVEGGEQLDFNSDDEGFI